MRFHGVIITQAGKTQRNASNVHCKARLQLAGPRPLGESGGPRSEAQRKGFDGRLQMRSCRLQAAPASLRLLVCHYS